MHSMDGPLDKWVSVPLLNASAVSLLLKGIFTWRVIGIGSSILIPLATSCHDEAEYSKED